jgi:signal transduction histidine kinase
MEKGGHLFSKTVSSLPDTNTILSELSHDLRTPLNTIIGFSGILLSHRVGALNEQQEKELDIILKRGTELLATLDQLIAYCKIVRGDIKLRQDPFAIAPFLDATVENLRRSCPVKKITLDYDPSDFSLRMTGDEERLYQIMGHIFDVGCALVKTREIHIKAKKLQGGKDASGPHSLRIEVAFTGSGGADPDSLFSWNGAGGVPAKVRFALHLSNFYITLMGGGLSVSRARGRMLFQLTL